MIRLGDRGPHVHRWRAVMNLRFGGLYTRLHGVLPTDTDLFGARAAEWQREYQVRTGQARTGEVSDADMAKLGIEQPTPAKRGVLLTVHGTGQPDPMGPGLPANTARAVLDLYDWQPVGNYSASAFPMWPSVQQGVRELRLQIDRHENRPLNFDGYSQGAVVVGQVLKHDIMNPQGSLHHRLKDVRKVIFRGNPMRQQGIAHFDEWIHPVATPDQHGIMEDRLEGLESAPFEVRDYAHREDMYAAVRDVDRDEYKVMIQKIIFRATDWFSGPDSVAAQLKEFTERPLSEGMAAVSAGIDAIRFFTNSAHGYNIYPGIQFLRS